MERLWNKEIEKSFFINSLSYATPEQLFYITDDNEYVAYWPKGYRGKKTTLQSRNSLIGNFTEKWTTDLIQEIVKSEGLYAVQGAVCDKISLPRNSPADVIISKNKNIEQVPEDILAILEVKMSIVWNWKFQNYGGMNLRCLGDYKTHQGNPSLLRSDSMLKAIGKSINIRMSGLESSAIPIIIIGNTPITENYYSKVDHLKVAGIVQGFWSINPSPLDDNSETIKKTDNQGFYRFDSVNELKDSFRSLLSDSRSFFSGMKSKRELGQIIEIANREPTFEKRGEVFLKLINE